MAMATIQSVVRCGWRAFSRSRKFPPYVRKAMQRIGDCRTAALGGHVKACRCGHLQKVWYNSCKHRSCPQCAFLEIEKWLYKQKQRLLNCDHYHVVFTVPAELNDIVTHLSHVRKQLSNADILKTLTPSHDENVLGLFREFEVLDIAGRGGMGVVFKENRFAKAMKT